MLRITRKEELEGIDRAEHGGVAYHIGENREIEVMPEMKKMKMEKIIMKKIMKKIIIKKR